MTASGNRPPRQHPHRDGRRTLCAAEGVLVALQHCSLDDAFLDIIATARRHNVAPLRLATALVASAQGDRAPLEDEAISAAIDDEWGRLLRAAQDVSVHAAAGPSCVETLPTSR